MLPGVSKEKVPDYYALTDLNLVTLRGAPLFQTVIPSKIFEIMAMARPILCSVDGECRKIIEEAGCGLFAEPENVENMVHIIRKFHREKEMLCHGKEWPKLCETVFRPEGYGRQIFGFLKQDFIFHSQTHKKKLSVHKPES